MLPNPLAIRLNFFFFFFFLLFQLGNFKWFESQLSLYLLGRQKIIALYEIKLIFCVRKNLLFPSITIFQVLKQPLSRFET